MPEIDPNNTGETPAAREALEQRKLALEIAELGKPLWRKAGFYAVVGPTMLGITTLGIGFQTGYFDTATERLDAEKVLLKIEEYKLIEEIDQIKDTLKKQSDDFDRNQETIKAELDQQRQNLKKEKVALRAKFESDTKTMLAKFEEEKRRLQASIKLSEYELAALEKAREDLEHSLIEEITRLTPILQDSRAVLQDGAVLRGFHPKSHGCVSAKFIVNQDIEERFQVGLFASPGKIFDARVRFSNASVRREHDLKNGMNDSRGMAIKVVDVEGDMLSEDDGQSNQDFLMINTPAFPFSNSRDYLRLMKILEKDRFGADAAPFYAPLMMEIPGLTVKDKNFTLKSFRVLRMIRSKTVRNPLQVQYFGAAPFLFGQGQVMKFSAKPCGGQISQKSFSEDEKATLPSDYIRASLTETMKGNEDVCFDFMIQVRATMEILDQLDIEDATTIWPDELENYKSVAQIIIEAPQWPDTPEAIEQCEALSYTPWHSLEQHQPVGSINRLRRDVYEASANHRLGARPAKP